MNRVKKIMKELLWYESVSVSYLNSQYTSKQNKAIKILLARYHSMLCHAYLFKKYHNALRLQKRVFIYIKRKRSQILYITIVKRVVLVTGCVDVRVDV